MRDQPPIQYNVLDVARAFSMAAHCAVNQKRKYTGEDYFHHPEEVLQILLTYDDPTLDMQVAALLHDVLEDTSVEAKHIHRVFGGDITQMVKELTDVSTPADGNRKARKRLDLEHIRRASIPSKRIKCADLISNSQSIVERDSTFAQTYLVEKLALLRVMRPAIYETEIWREAYRVARIGIRKVWTDPKEQYEVLWAAGFQDIRREAYIAEVEALT